MKFRTLIITIIAALAAAPANAQWVESLVSGPSARAGIDTMSYDSSRSVALLFGGAGPPDHYNGDTWEWDGTSWLQRFPTTSPSPRWFHATVYDEVRQVVVLFGGSANGITNGETWEWDGFDWTQRVVPGPGARQSHRMAYDVERGITVLYGGYNNGVVLNDTWEWDGTTWTQRCSGCAPGPRHIHGMAYDGAVSLLYGGMNTSAPGVAALSDLWQWDGTSWTELGSDCPPGPRNYFAMAGTGCGIVIHGGNSGSASCDLHEDTWLYTDGGWEQLEVTGPVRRNAHPITYDIGHRNLVLFGGNGGPGCDFAYQSDTWTLPFACQLEVSVDIKPGSCPNSYNNKGTGNGKLPVALVGTDDIDAAMVDPDSLLLSRADGVGGAVAPLMGPPGPGITISDTATPFHGELCDCIDTEGDGIADLNMKFHRTTMTNVLELSDLPGNSMVELEVSGTLLDGTEFAAGDCIRLVPPGDMDGDGAVQVADLLGMLAAWGSCPAPPADCLADINSDGNVGVADLLALLANWG